MPPWILQKLARFQRTASLVILAALLFEFLVALWLGFFVLFGLETLLPTFVTVRLSLANFLALLVLGTVFYLFLERNLPEEITEQNHAPRWRIAGTSGVGFILIALSLARFPLVGALIFLIAFLFLTWVLSRFVQKS